MPQAIVGRFPQGKRQNHIKNRRDSHQIREDDVRIEAEYVELHCGFGASSSRQGRLQKVGDFAV